MNYSVAQVTRGYSFLAHGCLEENFPGYSLKSTIHALHHFAVDLDLALQTGAQSYPNPLLFDNSQSEDFIGRTARVSRSTHARGTALRGLQRHLVKVKCLVKKDQALKKKRSLVG